MSKKEKLIESFFRKEVKKNKIKNAYLLVYSDKLGIDLNITEGSLLTNPQQPNYMASVGKIFTSIIISILFEREELSFDDKISKFLDKAVKKELHIYQDNNYTEDIKIKHLLNHTSGLYDTFWPLLEKIIANEKINMTPREVIDWGKKNLKTKFPPGKGIYYSDTNYYLLALIIEEITKKPFHEILKEYIFKPLNMNNSYFLDKSNPIEENKYPMADFFDQDINISKLEGYSDIDYAAGGVVAPMEDLLKFMKALVNYQIIKKETLSKIMQEKVKLYWGIKYSYGIWHFTGIPILMSKKINSWGVVGAIGSFMFYNPKTDSYLIGNFNDFSYGNKGLKFIIKIIKKLL